MGVREDQEELNSSGLRGVLREAMQKHKEGFVKVIKENWGEVVPVRPLPGSGPYYHFKQGFRVRHYTNASPDDKTCVELDHNQIFVNVIGG